MTSVRNMPRWASCDQRMPQIPFMALTATADDTTRRDIVRLLGLNDPLIPRSAASTGQTSAIC